MFAPLRISVFYTRVPTGKQPAFVEVSIADPFTEPLLLPDAPFKQSKAPSTAPRRPLPAISIPREQETFRGENPRAGTGRAPHASVLTHPATQAAWERLHGNPPQQRVLAPVREKAPANTSLKLPPGITLAPGRPRMTRFIEDALQGALALAKDDRYPRGLSGLLVGVCGPLSMVDDVVRAVGAIDSLRRDQVGGVEIVEEAFGW